MIHFICDEHCFIFSARYFTLGLKTRVWQKVISAQINCALTREQQNPVLFHYLCYWETKTMAAKF